MASPVLACNIEAISAVHRPRYNDLDSKTITLPEVSEWITMERLCCPFLVFQFEGAVEAFRLTMRGPEGAKAILQEEFPAGAQDG
jgi:hypothetical protein